MRVLDLFSGIGGFSLGLERAGMKTLAFCEIEPFCQKVLRKHWPEVPIYSDIKKLTAEVLKQDGIEGIDVICGGFPCQPYSIAGRKKGTEDNRDLWPEMFRVIKECKPAWVIGENVANFTDMAFTRTKVDLESIGYEVQPLIIPACAIGAPHRRDRVWILAYAHCNRLEGDRQNGNPEENMGKSKPKPTPCALQTSSRIRHNANPNIIGMANGIPHRVHRFKSLGNSVVPQIIEVIGALVMNQQEAHRN